MLTSLQHLTWLSSDLSTVQLYVRLTVSDPLYIKHNFSLYCDDEVNSCREVSEVRVNLRKTHLPPLNVEDAGRTVSCASAQTKLRQRKRLPPLWLNYLPRSPFCCHQLSSLSAFPSSRLTFLLLSYHLHSSRFSFLPLLPPDLWRHCFHVLSSIYPFIFSCLISFVFLSVPLISLPDIIEPKLKLK